MPDLESFLHHAYVDRSVFELRPDYRAMMLAVDVITPGASDEHSEALLVGAEASVRALDGRPVEELSHIASWREASRVFGAKPKRTRNSLEALTRRAAKCPWPRR
jgi:DNA/RNA-binding domain of Phe-tRNA-synthetase-like protein